jgi:pyruvate ferredoxin oxidoreductase beta subunit
MSIARLAVETCIWPSYEVDKGIYKINVRPKEKKPVSEFLKLQGRFRHLFKPDNVHIVEKIQEYVDEKWNTLQRRSGVGY